MERMQAMAPMTLPAIQVTRTLGSVLVSVRGYLDLPASIRLGTTLGDLIDDQGNLAVGVDLHQVTGVDPRALGIFAAAAKLATHRGGALTVVGLPARTPAVDAVGTSTGDPTGHLVHFYKNDRLLEESVRIHVEPALRSGDSVIVVATETHRHLFEAALTGSGIDVPRARASSRYVDLDAGTTLSRFMVDGIPDKGRFEAVVGGLIASAPASRHGLRVYGEMVAVLWGQGNHAAAIILEDLWNEVARTHAFALLCAYPTGSFDSKGTSGLFRTICAQHLPGAA